MTTTALTARGKGKKCTTSRVLTSKQHLTELQQEINERAKKEADKRRKAEDKIAKKQVKMYSSQGNVKKCNLSR